MFKIDFNFAGLLSALGKVSNFANNVKVGLAKLVNEIGEAFVDAVSDDIAAYTGFTSPEIMQRIVTTEATENNPVFEMDATTVLPQSTAWQRPWESRGREPPFDSNVLVNIVTMNDDRVCKICTAAARNNPYTLAETNRMFARWLHTQNPGLLHPNCRCQLEPADIGGRSFFGGSRPGPGGGMPPGLMNMRRIGSSVVSEVRSAFRKD